MPMSEALRRTAVGHHLLNAQGEAFTAWHESESALLPLSVTEYHHEWLNLTPAERAEIEALIECLPTAEDFINYAKLASSLTNGELARLRAEDRAWMAEIRCHLTDALEHARYGDFVEAHYEVDLAFGRLDWLLHGRSRKGDRYGIPGHCHTVLIDAHRMVATLLKEFGDLTRLVPA